MKFDQIFFIFLAISAHCLGANSRHYRPPKNKPQPKPKQVLLNTDNLPGLNDILEELGLASFMNKFVKMGVTETRLLLRLGHMDFHIMSYDWGMSDADIVKLKDKVSVLIELATIPEDVAAKPEYEERKKLNYGRVYLPNAVQSFEYMQASFGGPPPIGAIEVVMSDPIEGCEDINNKGYWNGKAVLMSRGNCSFLLKAKNAASGNATALIVINTEDRLDSLSSGLGVDKNITEAEVQALDKLSIISLANTTFAKLNFSYYAGIEADHALALHIVPLKCRTGGVCAPLVDEEKSVQPEVSWGTVTLQASDGKSRVCDFLTSNFGGTLPRGTVGVTIASAREACEPLNQTLEGQAVLVYRGQCRFDAKALHVQATGASLMIVRSAADDALQRLGGQQPDAGYVSIPSILITSPCAAFVEDSLSRGLTLTAHVTPSGDSAGADRWIDLAFTELVAGKEEKRMQIQGLLQRFKETVVQGESGEIEAWLQRRAAEEDNNDNNDNNNEEKDVDAGDEL